MSQKHSSQFMQDDDADSYQIQKQLNQFNNSKKQIRPQSGYRKSGTISSNQQQCFSKFNRFIRFHRIPIKFFWKKKHLNISQCEFYQLLDQIDFAADREFKKGISQKVVNKGIINLHYICSFIGFWSEKTKEIQSLTNQISKYEQKDKKIKRYSSSKLIVKNKPQSMKYQKQIKRLPYKTNIQFLKQRKAKQIQKSIQIQSQIQNKISQTKYNTLLKVGQANQMVLKLGFQTKYSVINKNKTKMLVCRNGIQLSDSQFRMQFGLLKRQLKQKNNLKYWQCAQNKQALRKLKATDQKNNQARDQQLKKILVQTVKLTIDLKRQIQLFQLKGINMPQHIGN